MVCSIQRDLGGNVDAEPAGGLALALDATGQLVAGVRDEQWLDPTPCPDWNVRDLVNHIIGGNRMFAGILRGERPAASSLAGVSCPPGLGKPVDQQDRRSAGPRRGVVQPGPVDFRVVRDSRQRGTTWRDVHAFSLL
jgi:hypothetical protein